VEIFYPVAERTVQKKCPPLLRVLSLPGNNVPTELFSSNGCCTVTWQHVSMPLCPYAAAIRFARPEFAVSVWLSGISCIERRKPSGVSANTVVAIFRVGVSGMIRITANRQVAEETG
jgi:hypothetical protein